MIESNNIICFYHEYDNYGCFSNWYPSTFEYAGIKFSSVEQYMMYHKVLMFHQYELADKIMATNNPSLIKRLGRTRFSNFDADLWDRTCYSIVKRGIRAKFEQNADILRALLATKNCILAEASDRDKKWGIGVSIDSNDCFDVRKWNGENLLGRILMEVREELKYLSELETVKYIDARECDFFEWNMKAGELKRNPKYYEAIHAYADTLHDNYIRNCFYYDTTLKEWEVAMRTNMGGGLPAIGFWELKQDIFDISRYS